MRTTSHNYKGSTNKTWEWGGNCIPVGVLWENRGLWFSQEADFSPLGTFDSVWRYFHYQE